MARFSLLLVLGIASLLSLTLCQQDTIYPDYFLYNGGGDVSNIGLHLALRNESVAMGMTGQGFVTSSVMDVTSQLAPGASYEEEGVKFRVDTDGYYSSMWSPSQLRIFRFVGSTWEPFGSLNSTTLFDDGDIQSVAAGGGYVAISSTIGSTVTILHPTQGPCTLFSTPCFPINASTEVWVVHSNLQGPTSFGHAISISGGMMAISSPHVCEIDIFLYSALTGKCFHAMNE